MADINKIPIGGVVTLTHSLAVYNSAVNGLLLNLIDFFLKSKDFTINFLRQYINCKCLEQFDNYQQIIV